MTCARDLGFGLRTLRSTPMLTGVAIVAIMLGVAMGTTIFSVTNGVLLHPLGPVDDDRLVILYATAPNGESDYPGQGDFFDWRKMSRSFEDLVARPDIPDFWISGTGQSLWPSGVVGILRARAPARLAWPHAGPC